MIGSIFQTIGTAISQFANVIGNGFTSLIALFWDGTAMTDLGTLALLGVGVGLVYWAFRLIRGLLRIR